MTKIIGKGFSTVNNGKMDSQGYWTVTSTITEFVEYEDGQVKTETVDAKCMDRSFDIAHQTALATALIMYREETIDRGMSGLVEAREKYGRLDGTSFTDSDTYTQ